ncbi:MAG: extracellular solute-binding protein [Butyrivibrio sp.]|nr:extracellular solute-binding protein [Acetatifactor muris]MCM1558168.1 extracellular solute-binding protein [Butyrivibrio sp.]
MKKGFVSKALSFGLAFALTAGLCACGGGTSEADPNLAKENVYRLKEIELPELYNPGNGDMSVLASAHRDGKVNLLVNVRDWNNYNEYDYRLITMNEDGSDLKVISLEIPEFSGGEAEGDTPVDAPVAYPEEPEGEGTEGADAEEPEGGEGADAAEPEGGEGADAAEPEGGEGTEGDGTEGGEGSEEAVPDEDYGIDVDIDTDYVSNNIWEYTNYSEFSMTGDGVVYAMKNHRIEDNSDPENYVSKVESSICSWDSEGKILWDISIGELNDRTWINQMMEGADDALYLMLTENNEDYTRTDYYRVRVGMDGSVGERKKVSDESLEVISNSDQIVPQGDGTAFIIFRDEDDWTKRYYAVYDVAADTLKSEKQDFPSSVNYTYDYNVMMPGISHDLVYTGNGGIYCWDQGDEAGRLMVNWTNSDLYIEQMYNIVELSKDSFLGFYREDWESGVKAGVFTHVAPEDIQDKKVLVLGGFYVDSSLKKRVIEYNRNNPEYRIVIKEYNSYNSYDDYTAGLTQLNNDIISGGMPDILINNGYNNLPLNNYISKGLIADIDKLLANDEELSQVEFMQNAFDAYRVNGKLYSIVPDFEIYTVIAKKSLVGDRESWTMEDMQQVLAGMGGETKAFNGETTRSMFIDMVMRYCGNQFVDVSTGKCAFNTEDFISMMEYAKTLPGEEGDSSYDEEYWEDYWNNYESQYRQNRTLLMQANFWRFDNLAYTINGQMGEEVSYVGFPTDNGNGSYVMSSVTYALSAKSKYLDEAWNFMRYYLTEDHQKENISFFPVRKDIFLEKSEEATKRRTWTWEDENGVTHEEEEDMNIWINGEAVPYAPLTQEQLDDLIAFIESVHNPYYYNEEVMNIITEEIEGYFSGQKPAADVADVIQRRVQNYVDENS